MNLYLLRIHIIGVYQLVFAVAVRSDLNPSMETCISKAINLLGERKAAIEFGKNRQDLASKILKKISVPFVLNTVEVRNHTGIERRTSNDVMLLLKDFKADQILKNSLWNGETRFLIISEDLQQIKKYFEDFWKLKVINVFAVVSKEEDISVYSYIPYKKQGCKITELIVADTCIEGNLEQGGFALKDPNRIKNMNACPVNITLTDVKPSVMLKPGAGRKMSVVKGFEGNLMAEVAKIYNYTATYKLADDGIGWGWVNPSPHGAIGEVYTGVSDMAIGMLGPLIDRFLNLDFSFPYLMNECVTFGIPQGYGTMAPAWISIFVLDFTFSTWSLIAFSFILISVNVWLINKYLNSNWFSSKTDIAIFLFSSCLGLPIKTPDHTSAKFSVIFWIVFTFIVTTAYKAVMGSKLAVPPRDADIYTFRELLKTDLELTGYENMYQLLMQYDDEVFKGMRKRYHYTNYSVEYAVDRIANGGKIAHLRHKTTFYYYALINPKARGRVHVLNDCLIFYQPFVVLKKYSPFTNRVSEIVSRLEEAGIMPMWRAEFIKHIPPPPKPFFKLSIEQMLGVFYFLLFGFVAALVSFLCELIFLWLGRNRKH